MVCVGPDIPLKPRSLGLAACQANASHWVRTYLMVPCDWALVPSHLPAVCMALTTVRRSWSQVTAILVTMITTKC